MKHSSVCTLQSADSIDVALTSPGNRDRPFKLESGISGDRSGKPSRLGSKQTESVLKAFLHHIFSSNGTILATLRGGSSVRSLCYRSSVCRRQGGWAPLKLPHTPRRETLRYGRCRVTTPLLELPWPSLPVVKLGCSLPILGKEIDALLITRSSRSYLPIDILALNRNKPRRIRNGGYD